MTRMGKGDFISRIYHDQRFQKIELKSEIQDIQYGGRLSKGDTYLIGQGQGEKEKFFLTIYHDNSVELWSKKQVRSGFQVETIVCLTAYEADCIYLLIDKFYGVLILPEENLKKTMERNCPQGGLSSAINLS